MDIAPDSQIRYLYQSNLTQFKTESEITYRIPWLKKKFSRRIPEIAMYVAGGSLLLILGFTGKEISPVIVGIGAICVAVGFYKLLFREQSRAIDISREKVTYWKNGKKQVSVQMKDIQSLVIEHSSQAVGFKSRVVEGMSKEISGLPEHDIAILDAAKNICFLEVWKDSPDQIHRFSLTLTFIASMIARRALMAQGKDWTKFRDIIEHQTK